MPKKVLIFSLAYFPHVGGAEIAVKEITDRISPADFSFDMVTQKFRPADASFEKIGNISVYRVGSSNTIFQKLFFPFRAFMKARGLHRKSEYNVIWSIMASYAGFATLFCKLGLTRSDAVRGASEACDQGVVTYSAGANERSNKEMRRPNESYKHHFPKVPLLLTLQEGENFGRRKIFKILFKMIFRRADRIQAISTFLANWARDMGAKCPVVVVPNGVDVERFKLKARPTEWSFGQVERLKRDELRKKLGYQDNDIVLITTSRLAPKNRVGDVIEAMKFLPENVKFLVLGSGPLESPLKLLVVSYKLEHRIQFVGFVSHSHLPHYLHAADIFIRTPLSEGFGNSYVEAMAASLPVIATPVGGILDFIRDNDTGLFARIGDIQNIAEVVKRLVENPSLREALVKNASKMVAEKYDWKLVAQNMTKVFENIS